MKSMDKTPSQHSLYQTGRGLKALAVPFAFALWAPLFLKADTGEHLVALLKQDARPHQFEKGNASSLALLHRLGKNNGVPAFITMSTSVIPWLDG